MMYWENARFTLPDTDDTCDDGLLCSAFLSPVGIYTPVCCVDMVDMVDMVVSCCAVLCLTKHPPVAVLPVSFVCASLVRASAHLREFGRTETIGNTSDPEFTKQFIMDYYFYEMQYIKAR